MDFIQVVQKLLPVAGVALIVGLIAFGIVLLAYRLYRKRRKTHHKIMAVYSLIFVDGLADHGHDVNNI